MAEHSWDPTSAGSAEPVPDGFCRLACLTYEADSLDRREQARGLLATTPALTHDHIWAAAAANDVAAVERLLASTPSLAARRGGPYNARPLYYLAYSRLEPLASELSVLAIARALLAAGADANEHYYRPGLATPFTLLTGCFGLGEQGGIAQPGHPHAVALATLLLEAGANPDDGQVLYNRMFASNDDHLELLLRFGLADAELLRDQLGWAIAHDQRDRVGLLLARGADAGSPLRDGRSPAESAAVNGVEEVLALLLAAGAPPPVLDPVDSFIAAAMAGDSAGVAATPPPVIATAIRQRASVLVWAAGRRRYETVRLLIGCGFDINAMGRADTPDRRGKWQTALHEPAHTGDVEMVRLLLSRGADASIKDARFEGTPLDWAEHANQDATADLLRG
jgi:hypothetical protein